MDELALLELCNNYPPENLAQEVVIYNRMIVVAVLGPGKVCLAEGEWDLAYFTK